MSTPTPGINTNQIKDKAVERHNLDTTDPGQAVVERLIAGTGITLSSTGADSGTGDVTISVTGNAGGGGSTPGTGTVGPATASSFGTVGTDITESGGSVVYSKTTMDSLLAGKISVGAALAESEITGLLTDLAAKLTSGAMLPESEITNLVADLSGKIASGSALPESEITGLVSDLAGKMAAGATLPESEITNLAADLAARLVVAGTPSAGQVPVVTSTSPLAVGWQTPALPKRRFTAQFSPPGQTADTAPNTGQKTRLPLGAGNAANAWKLMTATLEVVIPNANATTAQLYSAAAGDAAFSSPAACFGGPATVSGTGASQNAPGIVSGLSTTGLPGGTELAPLFSALGAYDASWRGPGIVLFTEWEEV